MLTPVDMSGGQVSGPDYALSPAPTSIVNWESDEAGINHVRPGLAAYSVTGLGTEASIGLHHWKSHVIDVTADRYIWAISDSVPASAIAASTATTSTQVGGYAPRVTFASGDLSVYIAGGAQLQRWAPGLVAAEAVSASPRCSHVVALSNYLVTNCTDEMLPSTVQWSDIGEGAWDTWPAANVMNADSKLDPVRAVYESAGELLIFGSESLQVHALGSDPTFPFELVTSNSVGIGAPYAFCNLDTGFVFLTNRKDIVISDGRSQEKISKAIQNEIRGFVDVSDCFMYREESTRGSYLVVRFPTARRTFVYDMERKSWRERDYYAAPFHADFPVSAHVYWPALNVDLMGSSLSGGGLMTLNTDATSASSRQDLGGPLVSEFTTGWQDFGTAERKQSSEIRLVMRRGTAAQGATPGILEIRRQCDDGPWSDWQHVSLGTPSQYQQVRRIFMRRIFRRCRYGVRYSSTDNTAIVSLHDDVTPLTDGAEAEARP